MISLTKRSFKGFSLSGKGSAAYIVPVGSPVAGPLVPAGIGPVLLDSSTSQRFPHITFFKLPFKIAFGNNCYVCTC